MRRKQVEIGKQWVELAHDTGAWGVKVRPNGLPKGVPMETTIENIAREPARAGRLRQRYGVEIWMEVHGPTTQNPPVAAAIMKATKHDNVGRVLEFQSHRCGERIGKAELRAAEAVDPQRAHQRSEQCVSVARVVHAAARIPATNATRCAEVDPESKEPERFLRYYRALWTELNRACG